MMVNCPKCGFSQPQDQYCAKCGVDMVAFRLTHKRTVSVFANPALQVSALALVAIGGWLFVSTTSRPSPKSLQLVDAEVTRDVQVQESELAKAQADAARARATLNETTSASVATASAAQPQLVASAAAAPAPQPAVPAPPVTNDKVVGIGTTSPVTAPARGIREALQPAQTVRILFIEAPRAVLQKIMRDARDVGGDSLSSYGVVANLSQQLRLGGRFVPLDTSGDQAIHINQQITSLKGTRDAATGLSVGVSVRVIPLSRDEVGTHLQIDANRTLRDPSTGLDLFNFVLPESITLPKGSSFMLTGVLPHRALGPDEQQLYRSNGILKAMLSDDFRRDVTDVAIIIEAK